MKRIILVILISAVLISGCVQQDEIIYSSEQEDNYLPESVPLEEEYCRR